MIIKRKYPDNVLLTYFNVISLRYKINDVRVLVSKFSLHYLIISENKIHENLLKNMTYKIIRIKKIRVKDSENLLERTNLLKN